MNLLEMEPELVMTPESIRPSGVIIDFMPEGYAIERDPVPIATMVITKLTTESLTVAPQEPNTDTAVVGEDKDAVLALLATDNVIRPSGLQESTSQAEKPAKTAEKNGFGNNALKALRRSRLGMYAVTAITAAGAFFATHTESAKAEKQPVGPAIELSNSIHFLEEITTSPVPTGPLPGEPTEPSGGENAPGGSSSSGKDSEVAPTDPKVLKQNCTDVALQKPKIVNAKVLHAGNFDVEKGHTQSWSFSAKYPKSLPDYCNDLYGWGNKAKAQAFHNGHWVDEGAWHSVIIIPENNAGSWEDIGNVKQVEFPVCHARILLKATSSDLSRDTGKDWAPHPIIASRTFPPVPVKRILPHKPEGC